MAAESRVPHSVGELLTEWLRRIRINIDTHNFAETHYTRLDHLVGGLALFLLVAAATAAGSLAGAGDDRLLVIALVSSLAGLFTALQAHFNWRERATGHRSAARQYASIRRAIETALILPADEPEARWRREEIRRNWDAVAAFAPNASDRIREKAKRKEEENPQMESKAPSWQSTLIALALILLAGGIFIVVYSDGGIDDALKAWAAIGTIVGVVTGAVPTYFFGQRQAAEAERGANEARQTAERERQRRDDAETKASLVLGLAPDKVVEKAHEMRPELFHGPN